MFIANGIVQKILNGTTYTELLRDLTLMQQLSADAIGPDYIVTMMAAMGCRLSLDQENIAVVHFNDRPPVNLPAQMRPGKSFTGLHYIYNEPFVVLPGWEKLFTRLEVAIAEEEDFAIVYRRIWTFEEARKLARSAIPSQMVCIPVMSLVSGGVRQVRLSFHNFLKTPPSFFTGGACIVRGRHMRKRIYAAPTAIIHTHDANAAIEQSAHQLAALNEEYSRPNDMTEAQGYMMRTLLDVRKRNAADVQAAVSAMHHKDTVG